MGNPQVSAVSQDKISRIMPYHAISISRWKVIARLDGSDQGWPGSGVEPWPGAGLRMIIFRFFWWQGFPWFFPCFSHLEVGWSQVQGKVTSTNLLLTETSLATEQLGMLPIITPVHAHAFARRQVSMVWGADRCCQCLPLNVAWKSKSIQEWRWKTFLGS